MAKVIGQIIPVGIYKQFRKMVTSIPEFGLKKIDTVARTRGPKIRTSRRYSSKHTVTYPEMLHRGLLTWCAACWSCLSDIDYDMLPDPRVSKRYWVDQAGGDKSEGYRIMTEQTIKTIKDGEYPTYCLGPGQWRENQFNTMSDTWNVDTTFNLEQWTEGEGEEKERLGRLAITINVDNYSSRYKIENENLASVYYVNLTSFLVEFTLPLTSSSYIDDRCQGQVNFPVVAAGGFIESPVPVEGVEVTSSVVCNINLDTVARLNFGVASDIRQSAYEVGKVLPLSGAVDCFPDKMYYEQKVDAKIGPISKEIKIVLSEISAGLIYERQEWIGGYETLWGERIGALWSLPGKTYATRLGRSDDRWLTRVSGHCNINLENLFLSFLYKPEYELPPEIPIKQEEDLIEFKEDLLGISLAPIDKCVAAIPCDFVYDFDTKEFFDSSGRRFVIYGD